MKLAAHRRIKRDGEGRTVRASSASRNRKFGSASLQRRVSFSPAATFERGEPLNLKPNADNRALPGQPSSRGWLHQPETLVNDKAVIFSSRACSWVKNGALPSAILSARANERRGRWASSTGSRRRCGLSSFESLSSSSFQSQTCFIKFRISRRKCLPSSRANLIKHRLKPGDNMRHVDGDACPVREEIYRVATRLRLNVLVVSDGLRPIRPPGASNVRMVVVGDSADAADDWIAERIGVTDVCVTSDIPLASRCLKKERASSPRLEKSGHRRIFETRLPVVM